MDTSVMANDEIGGESIAAKRRLILDARPIALGAVDPSRPLLGMPLLCRTVLSARRCGFGAITVIAGFDDARRYENLLASHVDVAVRETPPPDAPGDAPTVYAPADVLGEPDWLRALAQGSVADDACCDAGNRVVLCGRMMPPGQAIDDSAASGVHRSMDLAPSPMRVSDEADLRTAERRLLRALVKDTDGFMARHFARPISLAVSRRLTTIGVTANQMTFVCMLIGLAAAPFFLFAEPHLQVIGGLLFVTHSVLDGCDGELARLQFRESRFGGLFDFWSDNVIHVAIFSCMAIGWSLAEAAIWPLYVGTAAVGASGASAVVIYWLTLRRKTDAGPVYTSVSDGPSEGLTKLLDELSRRDFIYLVFALSAFGKAAWFLALTAIGAPIFLILVLFVAVRDARQRAGSVLSR